MARADIFSILYSKRVSALDFKWDLMMAPPLLNIISIQDIYALNQIAISNKLASKPDEKYKMMDAILAQRHFKRLASGTNRVVYKYLEDQSLCLKVAFDRVGLKDNPQEYQNQFKLRPFVTKIFEVSPCGTVALVERVEPIVTREEYLHVIDDVFNLLVEKIIGKYVVDDIGTRFFQNIGIRKYFGVVLLDFPYVYELDGAKMYCNWQDPGTHEYCLGEIDYDDGFNYLVCTKCGKQYQAKQLAKQVEQKTIVIEKKGVTHAMRIRLMRGDEVECIISTEEESNTTNYVKPKPTSGAKVLNKKNFDKRQKDAERREKQRKEAVADARERRDIKVSKSINDCLNTIASPAEVKDDTPKEIIVNAAEAAAKVNPSYMQTGRFDRVDNTPAQNASDYISSHMSDEARSRLENIENMISSKVVYDKDEIKLYPIEMDFPPDDVIPTSIKTDCEPKTDSVEHVEAEEVSSIPKNDDPVANILAHLKPRTIESSAHEVIDESAEEQHQDQDMVAEPEPIENQDTTIKVEEQEPVVEQLVEAITETEEDEDIFKDAIEPTKEELDASTWENPCRVSDIAFSYNDYSEVSNMY